MRRCFIKSGRAAALALLGLLLAGGGGAQAQDEARPDTLGVWDVTLTSKLSTTQAAYSNWTEGGINTLAFSAGLSGKAHRRTTRWEQTYACAWRSASSGRTASARPTTSSSSRRRFSTRATASLRRSTRPSPPTRARSLPPASTTMRGQMSFNAKTRPTRIRR